MPYVSGHILPRQANRSLFGLEYILAGLRLDAALQLLFTFAGTGVGGAAVLFARGRSHVGLLSRCSGLSGAGSGSGLLHGWRLSLCSLGPLSHSAARLSSGRGHIHSERHDE